MRSSHRGRDALDETCIGRHQIRKADALAALLLLLLLLLLPLLLLLLLWVALLQQPLLLLLLLQGPLLLKLRVVLLQEALRFRFDQREGRCCWLLLLQQKR